MNVIAKICLLGLSLSLAACSVLENDKIDYKSASRGNSLEVPPDLTQLSRDHFVLELFHGPTLAFKDFALQLLGYLLETALEGQHATGAHGRL